MAGGEKGYVIGAVERAFRVEDFLAGGDLLEWRSVRQVAAGAGVSEDQAYRILQTMLACGRAEQNEAGGFRAARGIVSYGLRLSECLQGHLRRFS
jgi:DNA-binding IclR family transcriptional regulator